MSDFLSDPVWQGIQGLLAILAAASAILNWLVPQLGQNIQRWSQRSPTNRVLIVISLVVFFASLAALMLNTPPRFEIVDGVEEDVFLIEGTGVDDVAVGDELVVYGEIIPDFEEPIGLLRIVSKNPNSINAQVVLKRADVEIRARFRVDQDLENLTSSRLEPAAEDGIGYLLESGRILLRNGAAPIEAGAILLALAPQYNEKRIEGYLSFEPPVLFEVTEVDATGRIGRLELLAGEWPERGTLLALRDEPELQESGELLYEADFGLFTSTSAECADYSYDSDLDEWVLLVQCPSRQANSFVQQPFPDFKLSIDTRKIAGNNRAWYGIVVATGYRTEQEIHHRFMISGLGTFTYEIATFDASATEQTGLEIVDKATSSPHIQRRDGINQIQIVRRGSVVEFLVNDGFIMARDLGIDDFGRLHLAPSVIFPNQVRDGEEGFVRVGFSNFVVQEP